MKRNLTLTSLNNNEALFLSTSHHGATAFVYPEGKNLLHIIENRQSENITRSLLILTGLNLFEQDKAISVTYDILGNKGANYLPVTDTNRCAITDSHGTTQETNYILVDASSDTAPVGEIILVRDVNLVVFTLFGLLDEKDMNEIKDFLI